MNKEKLSYISGVEYEIEIENNQVDVEQWEHKNNVYVISKDLVKPLTFEQLEEGEYYFSTKEGYIKLIKKVEIGTHQEVVYKWIYGNCVHLAKQNYLGLKWFKNKEFSNVNFVISHKERKGEHDL